MKLGKKQIVCISVSAVILAIILVLNIAIGIFAPSLDKFVIGYKAGKGSMEARADGAALSEQIQAEGTVLVKNAVDENNNPALPLDKEETPRLNVFGWAATDWVVSGSGSGQVKRGTATDFLEALTEYGVGYNQDLIDMYENFRPNREFSINGGNGGSEFAGNPQTGSLNRGSLHAFNYEFSRLYEPAMSDYSESLLSGAKSYSDTAVVVIGRVSGESNDSPKVQYKKGAGTSIVTGVPSANETDKTRTYLEISTEEEALLEYVGKNYEKVIVLINSTNVMELGFMNTIEGLDACLIVGTTGSAGALAIPKILYGEVNPSGKTADTYAYDLSTSSTYVDTGSGNDTTHFYTNGNGLYPTTTTHTNGSSTVNYEGVAYQDYREGIYLGYKWYETADVMGFWTSDFAKRNWGVNGYNEVVQYPFGYGLSYTEFTWKITYMNLPNHYSLNKDDVIKIGVTVKNTGTVPGMDVVELYYTAPYTQGGIEKSAVNLAAFGKTQKILEPQEEGYVELEVKVSDLASYDSDEIKVKGGGYILEQGTYTFTLRTDAHTLAGDKMVEGEEKLTDTVTFTVDADTRVMTEASNRFTGMDTTDGVAIDGNSDGSAEIVYLSRSNFADTFPIEFGENRAMSDEIRALNLYTQQMATAWDDLHDEGETFIFGDTTYGALVYENGHINDYGIGLGLDYDEPEWENLLNRISKSEMQYIVLHGYTKTMGIASIGKPKTLDLDGPNQIGSFADSINKNEETATTGFSSIVLAQSWNLELAYSMGLAFGAECVANGVQGWYGPGINPHRSPFGGRNYEYYSEDAYISGMMCAKIVEAAKNKGVFCYLKHICLYEGESGRDGMYTWVTEQALREVYLKPFEIAVKEGGSNAIMTSYGRIGAVWTGGSEALLTEVVRNEWGFQGAFLTDYADHREYMIGDQMLRAGGDLWMDGYDAQDVGPGSFKFSTTSSAYEASLRRATKNIVYMWLNSLATNAEYNRMIESGEIEDKIVVPTSPELNFRWYIPVVVVVDVVLCGGIAALMFVAFYKKKKPATAEGEFAENEPEQAAAPVTTETIADDDEEE